MFESATRNLLLLASIAATLGGCGVYQHYGHGWLANSKLDPSQATAVELPAQAPSISQRYRPVAPPGVGDHRGFDILVASNTPVLAAGDGVVAGAGLSVLYGRQLMLNHGRTADGYRIQTRYFHLSDRLVRKGETVRRGQPIGYSGLSGLAGGFPHLHFEVHRLNEAEPPINVQVLDPQLFWVDGPGRVTCYRSGHDFPLSPARLTYPVPCRGIDWQ
jgi:murein DD-endopeptidase MepM/ murein hydrolase activator NlpD